MGCGSQPHHASSACLFRLVRWGHICISKATAITPKFYKKQCEENILDISDTPMKRCLDLACLCNVMGWNVPPQKELLVVSRTTVSDTRESQPQVASLKLVHQRQSQVPQKPLSLWQRRAHAVELRSTSVPTHGAGTTAAPWFFRKSASQLLKIRLLQTRVQAKVCIFACDNSAGCKLYAI